MRLLITPFAVKTAIWFFYLLLKTKIIIMFLILAKIEFFNFIFKYSWIFYEELYSARSAPHLDR